MRHTTRTSLLALLVALLSALLVVPAAAVSGGASAGVSAGVLGGDPPGANDWDCVPTVKRPTPVILVHGTMGDRKNLLEGLSRSIKSKGFCVFSLDYGDRGLSDIRASAKQLKRYTKRVLRATGASKVSMVGHSQGGLMPRYLIKFLRGKKLVDDLVGIAPSNHGTAFVGGDNPISALVAAIVNGPCRACVQQGAGSPFLTRLNQGDETPGRVNYTQITTRYDQVVVPHTSGYLTEGRRTTNLTLQDLCPTSLAEHVTVPLATPTIDIVLDALTRRGPASKKVSPRC
ncbi:esterase/lipase family protein [Nocardioides sp.]|uniref:esterase/lipase family protein n=1 Tax=Nocardioides sp. TaxID=35761 RepID=UPI002B26EB12|nr:alpha/beta fold hydrolase [Nocardioides sp.]